MTNDKNHFHDLAAFIKEHRSNEANFGLLYKKLEEEIRLAGENELPQLQELRDKTAAEYTKAKETAGTAWPEYEKFVSDFEKLALGAAEPSK